MCVYYPRSAEDENGRPTQTLWHSRKFSIAVKERTLNGYLDFLGNNGRILRIDEGNIEYCRRIFGRFIFNKLKDLDSTNLSVIPIPSKDGLVGASTFRSLAMLREALSNQDLLIEPVLRFTTKLEKAHAGGSRSRTFLAKNMTLTGMPSTNPIVLVDDILTSGNSILASYDVLKRSGINVKCAIVCGFTDHDVSASAFERRTHHLETELREFDF